MAVVGETVVHTLRGPQTVAKLAAYGEPTFCFTVRDGRITVGKVWVWPEPYEASTNLVVLDDGTTFRATPYQGVVRRDGGEAVLLPPLEMSCMPLYLSRSSGGYPTYKQVREGITESDAPADRMRYRPIARMVYEWKSGEPIPRGMIVRHADKDKMNCEPDNLKLIGRPYANKRRRILEQMRLIRSVRVPPKDNHRVVAVQKFGRELVYDLDTALSGCSNVGACGVFLTAKDG